MRLRADKTGCIQNDLFTYQHRNSPSSTVIQQCYIIQCYLEVFSGIICSFTGFQQVMVF